MSFKYKSHQIFLPLNSYERRAISRALKRIFDKWYEVANPSNDYEIEPLPYVSNQSVALQDETTPHSNQ